MVNRLRAIGACRAPRVEAAMRAVERHLFVPEVGVQEAYANEAILTKVIRGATVSSISQPLMVAEMLDMLAAEPRHSVLEIGAGTGYNAALLAHVVGPSGRVTTIEIDDDLAMRAERALARAGFHDVVVLEGDGRLGVPDAAPFDRIIVTAGAERVEEAWASQLVEGGRLVLPLANQSRAVALEKIGGALVEVLDTPARFVPLRGPEA
ncbi:MAG: methyltransferase domain-containing protein [Actinobacteria bacterium]|nr:methyltransferase domain-containing protein [Actinomycetota bacterium]